MIRTVRELKEFISNIPDGASIECTDTDEIYFMEKSTDTYVMLAVFGADKQFDEIYE